MKRKEIILSNRYGNNIRLIPTDNPKLYIFDMEDEWDYLRVGYEGTELPEEGPVAFIDPSGGPFLSKGTEISKDLIIDSIVKTNDGYIINFE